MTPYALRNQEFLTYHLPPRCDFLPPHLVLNVSCSPCPEVRQARHDIPGGRAGRKLPGSFCKDLHGLIIEVLRRALQQALFL